MFWPYETKCQTRFETTSINGHVCRHRGSYGRQNEESELNVDVCDDNPSKDVVLTCVCVLVKINVLAKTPDVSQHRCGVHNMI